MRIGERNWTSTRLLTGLGMAMVGITATAAAAVVVHEAPPPVAEVATTASVDDTIPRAGDVAAPTTGTTVVESEQEAFGGAVPADEPSSELGGPASSAGAKAAPPTTAAAPLTPGNVPAVAAASVPAGLPEAVQDIVGSLGSLPVAVGDCIRPAIDTVAGVATGGVVPGIELAASIAGPVVDCVAAAVATVPLPFGLDGCTASVFDLVGSIVGDLGSVVSTGPAGILATVAQVPGVVSACVPDLSGIGDLPGGLPGGLPGLPGGLPDLEGLRFGPAGAFDLVDDLLGGFLGGLPIPGGLFGGAGAPVG